MQRRAFNQHLQRSAIALALSPWLTAVAAPTDKPRAWRVNPFALGVASGRPRADSVVLWTRLLFSEEDRALGTEAVRVQVEVFADAALQRRVQKAEVVTDETRGHSVHLHLQNLQPAPTIGIASSKVMQPAPSATHARHRPCMPMCGSCAWP